jgi:Disulphide bond corrector protein DsbC
MRRRKEPNRSDASRLLPIVLIAASLALALPASEGADVRARILAPSRVASGSKTTLTVEMTIAAGLHVNSHSPSEPYLIPTAVSLKTSVGSLSPVRYPKDVEKSFSFSDKPLRVYEGVIRIQADLELPGDARGSVSVTGELSYQACNDKQCFPPKKPPLESRIPVSGAGPS